MENVWLIYISPCNQLKTLEFECDLDWVKSRISDLRIQMTLNEPLGDFS